MTHFACHPKVGRRRHASSARPGQDPTGSDISEVEARAQALAEVIDQFLMPAIVANRYQEVLAANPIARALSPEFAPGKNFLRRRLLDRAAQELYVTWDEATASAVDGLRDLACPCLKDQRMRAPRVSSTRWATQSTRAVSDNGCGSAVRSPTGPSVPPPQFTVVPERLAVPPPDELGDDVGAALGIPGITAHRAVFSDGPVGGKTLLVHGVLGGVSSLAAQLARWGGVAAAHAMSATGRGRRNAPARHLKK